MVKSKQVRQNLQEATLEDAGDNPGEDTNMYIGGEIDAREAACGGGRPSNIDPSKVQNGIGDPASTMM